MQVKEIHRTGFADVMQEGECRSPAPPLHQYSNEQLSVQKQSTIGNNKNQQHGKKSQQDEDSPKNSNKKSKSNLSEKKKKYH